MKYFLLHPEKKVGIDSSRRFREKRKNRFTPTHSNSEKNDVTEPKL